MSTLATAESANVDFDQLAQSLTVSGQPVDAPKIETLFELESLCQPGKSDSEVWQILAVGAAHTLSPGSVTLEIENWQLAIGSLKARRYFDWKELEFEDAEAAICGEVNHFFRYVFQGDDMATKTKRAKPSLDKCPECEGIGKVDSMKRPSPNGFLCIHCSGTGERDSGPLATLEDDEPNENSESAFDKIRASEFAALKEKGKSQTKEPTSNSTGPMVRQVVEIPVAKIVDSPFQTRDEPSDAAVRDRAESFKRDGQRDPIRVRAIAGGKYELIAGHIRTRAARLLKWLVIAAYIVEADDAEAARQVFDDNEQREDLNQIERARGLQVIWERYQAFGKTMDAMATDLGIDQSTISNRIRLLKAPASLQARLISGEIAESRLRDLAKWAKYDGVIKRFETELNNRCSSGPVEDGHWKSALRIALEASSRPSRKSGHSWGAVHDPLFDTGKHATELDIVEVNINGSNQKRCFNVKLWTKLQNEAKKRKKERDDSKASKGTSNDTAGKPSKEASKRTVRHAIPIDDEWTEYLWTAIGKALEGKLTRSQTAAASRLIELVDMPMESSEVCESVSITEAQWSDKCLEFLKDQWQHGRPWDIEAIDLLRVSEFFGCEAVENWKPSGSLLSACELLDLKDFAEDLNVDQSLSKPDLVEMLEQCWRPGWVPELFMIDVPKTPAKKSKRS